MEIKEEPQTQNTKPYFYNPKTLNLKVMLGETRCLRIHIPTGSFAVCILENQETSTIFEYI